MFDKYLNKGYALVINDKDIVKKKNAFAIVKSTNYLGVDIDRFPDKTIVMYANYGEREKGYKLLKPFYKSIKKAYMSAYFNEDYFKNK